MPVSKTKKWLQSIGLKKAISYLETNPEENIPKLFSWVEKFDRNQVINEHIQSVKPYFEDKNNNWYQLGMSMFTDIDDGVRKKLFENFILYASVIGGQRQRENSFSYHCNIPWAILMDPTSACNLHCKGCWAADYGNQMSMNFETLNNIIEQGKALGTFMYIYSGGEPLMRKKDIIQLCEKHSDCTFLAFTNGTLLDEKFAEEMLRVKNFVPALSVEGFEKETDFRRGKGTYQAVVQAMNRLKEKKLPFGISCCYTSQNSEVVGSEEYIDSMIELGAKFAWFFTYMPVGINAMPELIATADQRKYMYYQIREFRKTKPIFTLDFWNDGEYAKGCIAGGRKYLHINANGDIEPCAFIHYSDANIYERTLLEAYQSPLFMQYYHNQPFNENHLQPCPLLDNKWRLAEMVEQSGAVSTDLKKLEDVRSLCKKCEKAADAWEPVAKQLWDESHSKDKELVTLSQ